MIPVTELSTSHINTFLTSGEMDQYAKRAADQGLSVDEFLSKTATRGIDLLDIATYTTAYVSIRSRALLPSEAGALPRPIVILDRFIYMRALGLAKEYSMTQSDIIRVALSFALPVGS